MDNTTLAVIALDNTVQAFHASFVSTSEALVGLLLALIFAASWRWHL